MNKLVLLLFFGLISITSYCDEFIVSGKVYGYNKQLLSGATVALFSHKNRMGGTVTDSKGFFNLDGLDKGDSLVFTYIGYSIGCYVIKSSSYIELQLDRQSFCPIKSSYKNEIMLWAEQPLKFELLTEKLSNIKTKNIVREENGLFFREVELGPGSKNLSKLDSLLTTRLLREIKIMKSGNVKIGFIIDKDEKLKDFVVIQSYQKDIDERIFDLVIQNTKWFSARQNGNATTAYCEIAFKITKKKINLIANPN